MALSLSMANTSGHSKKLTVNAMIFVSYCVANMVAPQTFQASEAPHYQSGYNSIAGFEGAAIVIMFLYIVGVKWENHRRDRLHRKVIEGDADPTLSFDDLTDWEKPNFRYVC